MLKVRILAPLLTVLFMACLVKIARAECVGYMNLNQICIAKNCSGGYTQSTCTFGCTSGECEPQGGSGVCCGKTYYNAQIQPDGGHGCGDCGDARTHAALPSGKEKQQSVELWIGAALRRAEIGGGRSYRMPRLVFVADRCAQRYGLVVEEGSLQPTRGM
jgi:hypothetical protein